MTPTAEPPLTPQTAQKLRAFLEDLDPDERAQIARLLLPGMTNATAASTGTAWYADSLQRWFDQP